MAGSSRRRPTTSPSRRATPTRGSHPAHAVLHGPPGRAYVYLSYGIHSLLNAVCEAEGIGAAVLIRALEPLDGLDQMAARRGRDRPRELCNGPGKLTQALGIGLGLNGSALDAPIAILPAEGPPPDVAEGTRIGITKAVELPWRFCDADSDCVSAPRLTLATA